MVITTDTLSNVDINLLRIFCTIVECGGFTQSQVELSLSRSTISIHMTNLESKLGFRLCQRGRAGFSLTSRGKIVYESSRSLLASIEGYHSQIAQLRDRIVGEITIGVVDNIVTNDHCHLYKAIEQAQKSSNDLRLILRIAPPDQIEEQLMRGHIQLAIAPKFQVRSNISQIYLFSEYQQLYCGRNHPLFHSSESEITEETITDLDYVRRGYMSNLAPYHSIFKHPALGVSHQMEGLAHFVLSGRCVGFLPQDYAEQWVQRGDMRVMRPDLFCYEVKICLARNEQALQSLAATHVFNKIIATHSSKLTSESALVNPNITIP